MHKNCPIITTASGFGVCVFGIFGTLYLFPTIINSQIHANIDLRNGTMGFDTWEKPPFPIKFKIWFFNVSNPEQVQMGAKPILKEIGPYVYDQYRERQNVQLDKKRDVLKYMLKKLFYFNKKESNGLDDQDEVTILNAALVGVAIQVERMLPTAVQLVNDAVPYLFPGVKNIFITLKVHDVLFGGKTLKCEDEAVDFICGAMKGNLPKTMKLAENNRDFIFAFFKHLNNTDIGPWEMERGMKNSTRGEVLSYENVEEMDIWGGETCNMINGSDSTVFQVPKKVPFQRIETFVEDFCRTIFIDYENNTKEFGINAYRYTSVADPFNYDSGAMRCFCPIIEDDEGDEHVVCPTNGLADVTECVKAPVLISFPHFYLADPKLLDYVQGLKPQKDLHENYLHLEPQTATPLSGRKRIQLNMEVKPIEDFPLLENVTTGVFPIFWLEEGVTLPADFVKILKTNFALIAFVNVFKWLLIFGGLGVGAGGVVMIMQKEKMFCFGKTDAVDITRLNTKSVAESPAGNDNPAFQNTSQVNLNKPNNNIISLNGNRQRISNGANNWKAEVWHSGENRSTTGVHREA